jgi:hypothetical protein
MKQLSPMFRVLKELTVIELARKFADLYGTRFTAAFTRARHQFLS